MADQDHERSPEASESLLGIGWGFPPVFRRAAPGRAGAVGMTTDEEDVAASLGILFRTWPGERELNPRFGLDLHELLFDAVDTTTRTALADRIQTALLIFEPRIDVDAVRIEDEAGTDGRLAVHVAYTIRTTNSRFNLVFPFYRNDASEVREGWL